jgi:hypothetical protein
MKEHFSSGNRNDRGSDLIPQTKVEGLRWQRPDKDFRKTCFTTLEKQNAPAALRREKGHAPSPLDWQAFPQRRPAGWMHS